MKEKTLWIMVGIPGSGKTWCAKNKLMRGPGWGYVSRDEIRFNLVSKNEDYFSKEKEVFKTFANTICSMLNTEGIFNVIADATHLNEASRQKLLKAIPYNCNIIFVVVKCNFTTALQRNENRDGRACIPRSALNRMSYQLQDPSTDIHKNDYDGILYFNNDKENI